MSELGHKAGRYGSRTPTGREEQVVALVAEGLRNAEIAYRIGTTEQVVKNYLRVIFDKLGVWTRLELALWHERRRDDEELRATVAHPPTEKGQARPLVPIV